MRKRILGRTGLEVSEIGFGGIPIQRVDEKTTKDVILECRKQKINFIDTARGYTVSEELIGNALEGMREDFIIATKSMARDYEAMKRDIEISLKNLRTDYIDLYQFHFVKSIEEVEKIMSDDGAYKALLEAKNAGKIGHIGITSHNADILENALENYDQFETIQFPYNPVESQGEKLFEKAHEKNIGVIVMKPIAGGAIDNGELSLKYILNNKNVTIAIPGMESVEKVQKNSAIGYNSIDLSRDELEELEKIKADLSGGFCRRCGYCLPCVKGIDIPAQFIVEGYLMRYNLPEWASKRYEGFEIKADDCIECGVCEDRCPYNLNIRTMLKRVAKNFKEYRESNS